MKVEEMRAHAAAGFDMADSGNLSKEKSAQVRMAASHELDAAEICERLDGLLGLHQEARAGRREIIERLDRLIELREEPVTADDVERAGEGR